MDARELVSHLWDGMLRPDELAIVEKLGPAVKRFAKGREASFAAYRKVGRGGKPGAVDDRRVVADLAHALEGLARDGRALKVRLPGGKKPAFGYALVLSGAPALSFAREAELLAAKVDELRRQADVVAAVVAKLAPSGGRAAGDSQAIDEAYARLDATGRGYVPIARVRRAVNWSRERFDGALEALRRSLAIELHVGTPSDFSADDVLDSYTEPDGTLYLTMSWRR